MKKQCTANAARARRPIFGRRFARLEQLEERSLLTAVVNPGSGVGSSGPIPIFDTWHNPLQSKDVNGDTRVSALDALMVINAINKDGARQLPPTPGFGVPMGGGPAIPANGQRPAYLDVNDDGRLSLLDALGVINRINSQAEAQVRIRLETTDIAGNPILSTPVDSDFLLKAYVEDIRATPTGVYAAYMDIEYADAVTSVDGAIEFDPFYLNGISGSTATAGLIDEVGSFATGSIAPGPGERLQFTIPFHADASGVSTFEPMPGQGIDSFFAVFGEDLPIPGDEVEFIPAVLIVGTIPSLSIDDQSITEGDDGTQDMTFTVSLSAPAVTQVTMDYAAINGTATSGDDFSPTAGTLTFETGEITKTITVPIIGDDLQEGTEVFTVELTNITGAPVTKSVGTGTIVDNEFPPVGVSISDATVTEGDSGSVNAVFTVTLEEASDSQLTVDFDTEDGTALGAVDYAPLSGTVTFNPGVTSQTVTVTVFGDALFEDDETFNVVLSGGTGVLIQRGTGVGTITDDDTAPSFSINDVTVSEGHNITLNAVFTVTLSAAAGVQLNVDYATSGQTATSAVDFTPVNGTLNFGPGEVTKTIIVPILSDSITDAGETFAVNLSNASAGTIVDGLGIGTILDPPDDVVRIRLEATDLTGAVITNVLAGEEFFIQVYVQDRREDAQGVFQAFLDILYPSATVQATTVFSEIQFGQDYPNDRRANLGAPGVVDEAGAADGFTPLGEQERLLFRIPFTALANGVARFAADPADDQVFNQVLVFGSDVPVSPSQVLYEGTVVQVGPPPTVSINDVTVVEGSEAVFTVTLSNTTLNDVTVNFTTANGTAIAPDDYEAGNGSVTFEAEGALTREIRIPIAADSVDEDDETFFVRLTGASVPITDDEGVATILATPPSLFISDVAVVEGNAGETEATFIVTLSKASELTVTVDYETIGVTASDDIDFQTAGATLIFAPGEVEKIITVLVNGDLVDEDDEQFEVILSNQTNALIGVGVGVGTIIDDEISPGSISGYVYFDANANGLRDLDETGLSGVFIDLQGVAFGVPVFQSTITGFDGSYSFFGLQPGRYIVREIQPGFFTDGLDQIGTQGGDAFNDEFHIVLSESVNGLENNFGEGGLRSQFLSKRLFMGSAPPNGPITGLSVAAGDMWFSFDRGFSLFNVQAASNTARPVYMTLYDEQMRVVATTTPAGFAALSASGVLGNVYYLRVGGGSTDLSLSFNVVDASTVDAAIEDPFLLEVL